jgi:hypothetical protein
VKATDLSYLLHKNPSRIHTTELAFGNADLFYPEGTSGRCTAALVMESDPIFVRREPLRRVHECAFGVLALESEPVDPRL